MATILKPELMKLVALRAGLKRADVEAVVNALIDEIIEQVHVKNDVRIYPLGTVVIKKKAPRVYRDPQGRVINIPEGQRVVMRLSRPVLSALES